uniref:DEP domain containing 4 n=1 Tax=Corvus moneduloides TaxID=1196302 RepID=A0A8C3DPW2_CORMO
MAGYLTPRFRRIRSQSELQPRRGSGRRRDCDGPFQATQLWNSIIHALHNQVEIKRRRQHLKTYRNCFTGSNAVDVVLSHLMQSMYLSCNDISRLKGVRVCQALMDHKVFEPVGAKLYLFKNGKETEFEDTDTSLYRFVNSSLDSLLPRKNKDNESFSPERICKQKTKRCSITKCDTTLSNPLALEVADKKRVEELLQSIYVHASSPPKIMVNEPTRLLSKGEKGKTDHALEALQLYLKLLAPNISEELHRLLTFLAIASESHGYRLQKQFENRFVIIKTCTKFILQNRTLSKLQAELLTQFLMDNHSELFKAPLTLLELTSRRLQSLLEGQDPDINSGFTFCQRITPKEYEDQKQQTNQHLLALIQEMDNDPTVPLKQKKKLIKEFRKYHSLVYCSGCKTTCEFCTPNG